ncbi:MAG: UDP-2,3-diacylglucosamine diphosphatase [Bacteroidetes bacterium]|nr:MAG: UDP-2,3-diacylglucosamine diphosphatase [Bacteroidota bacterium]
MNTVPEKKIYFASDFHLGAPDRTRSLEREKLVCEWMDSIREDCQELYLLGDVFDFWFEYKQAIPRGFVRLQAKIASFTDAGIPVHFFIGNHDMWIFDYLPEELGVKLYREPVERELQGRQCYIGHGDGLGPGDRKYKFIKKVFASKLCQWLFARLHPNFGIGLAAYFSRSSRATTGDSDAVYLGDEKEWLVIYCKEVLRKRHIDYFIFGHRHLPLNVKVGERSNYINLGDWIRYFTFGVMENGEFRLKKWEKGKSVDFFEE